MSYLLGQLLQVEILVVVVVVIIVVVCLQPINIQANKMYKVVRNRISSSVMREM